MKDGRSNVKTATEKIKSVYDIENNYEWFSYCYFNGFIITWILNQIIM